MFCALGLVLVALEFGFLGLLCCFDFVWSFGLITYCFTLILGFVFMFVLVGSLLVTLAVGVCC